MKIKQIIFFICFTLSGIVNSQIIMLGKLQVSNQDLPGYYTQSQASVYLSQNKEWRLPTIEELQTIYTNRNLVSGLKYGGDSYLAEGKQNNLKFPNSQAAYGWAESWALEMGNGRWVKPSSSTQLLIRLVKIISASPLAQSSPKKVEKKSNNSKQKLTNNFDSPITTYSASYGLTGSEFDQPEIQFNLETTYLRNQRFTQLYRWRYTMGNYKGLIFEYNNRIYFGKNRSIEPAKWYIQGKAGYGLLKGIDYLPNTISYFDNNTQELLFNNSTISDSRHMVFNYGLSLGYKFIIEDRVTFDFHTGYVGYTQPNFGQNSSIANNQRNKDWTNGISSPFEFHWSIGFFLD